MFKKNKIKFVVVLLMNCLFLSLFFSSCEKESQPEALNISKYSGAGSIGDILYTEIDKTKKSIYIKNETNTKTSTTTFGIYGNSFNGAFYNKSTSGVFSYCAEMANKFMVSSFPNGNTNNLISVSVSDEVDNTTSTEFAGDYFLIQFDSAGYSTRNKTWCIANIGTDKTWKLKSYATGIKPENANIVFPIVAHDNNGTWQINTTKKNRLTFTDADGSYTGFAYNGSYGSMLVVSRGAGDGFLAGVKVKTTLEQPPFGSYKMVGVTYSKSRKVVAINLNENGSATYESYSSSGQSQSLSTLGNLSKLSGFQNILFGQLSDDSVLYIAIDKNSALYFIVSTDGFVEYGAGVQLQ